MGCFGAIPTTPPSDAGAGPEVLDAAQDAERDCCVATSLSAGDYHNCAVLQGGEVRCWGSNRRGQLGLAPLAPLPAGDPHPRPAPLSAETAVPALTVTGGGQSTCAFSTTHQVWCWGENEFGQLGDGMGGGDLVRWQRGAQPVALTNPLGVIAGAHHGCSIVSGGQVRCWGRNDSGQLGADFVSPSGGFNAAPTSVQTVPPARGPLGGVQDLYAGDWHSCAQLFSGDVVCWGGNTSSQLGLPTSTSFSPTPVRVDALAALGPVSNISARGYQSCAVIRGAVYCWGDNAWGQLGNPTMHARSSADPVQVLVDSPSGPLTNVRQVAVGGYHVCAIAQPAGLGDEAVYCWGASAEGQLGDPALRGTPGLAAHRVPLAEAPSQLAVGQRHSCVLTAAGAVWCWGLNSEGQVGDGSTTQATQPTRVRW